MPPAALLVDPESVVVDAKSGVSGAGRAPRPESHAGHVLENLTPYRVGRHQHAAEIEQALGLPVCFVPHLLPVRRGLVATCYARAADGDLRERLEEAYAGSHAVAVLDPFREKILADGNGIKLADYFSDLKDNMVSGFWISTRSWADANVAAVRAFREASEEAISLIKADPAGAKEIEAKYLGVKTTGFWTFDVSIAPEDIQPFVAYSKDLGLLRRDVDVTRLVAK